MKKILALLLAAMMCASLAACGSNESPNKNDTPISETLSTETEAPETKALETETPVETAGGEETTAEPAETVPVSETKPASETESKPETEAPSAPSFDTSWAGEEYSMSIPEPPFRTYVTFSENQNMYTVINADTGEEISYNSVTAYCEILKSMGFTDIELEVLTDSEFSAQLNKTGGAATAFIAKNSDGHRIVISKEFSTWMILVYCPKTEPVPAAPSFDTSWAANEFEALLPKLPFDGWTAKQKSDTEYKMELGGLKDSVITDESGKTVGYGEDKTALIAYLDSLKGYGFRVEETGGIEGYEYEWMVIDPSGNEIEFVCAEGYCWITITKK